MATGKISFDEGTDVNAATNTISEDAVTKHINRTVLNSSTGTEIGTSAAPVEVNLRSSTVGVATSAKQDTGNTSLSAINTDTTAVAGGVGATGDASVAAGATGSVSAKLRRLTTDMDAVKTSLAGTLTVGSHAVTNAGTFAVQAASAGDVAHDDADSGNPVKVGGKATNVEPTAVSASGDRANFITDLVGKLITLPYANPENFVSGAITSAMTGTTSTSLVAAPAAGLRNYITTIVCSNSHATVGTDIVIQDGNGGTTLMTIPAAAVYGGAVINLPVPLRQPTTATAIYCANVTTGASTKVSAVGYKGV